MNAALREVKEEILTERLVLRAPRPGDGEEINRAVHASINELSQWLPFAFQKPTVEDTESNTRKAAAKFLTRENLRYLILSRESGELIGSTGFHNIDWDVPKLEIGYWIVTEHSGKGYITEAVQALTTYALNDLDMARVEIQCDRENMRSRSIPEKLGYELEGILKNDDRSVDGSKLTDTCIYAKVKEEA
ncbi:GNAT family N-acetyltransferase [Halobacillus litoralis]|uniref:GNAT family N-acetyltransferase n=1 Tax=Halobacillus litoralis TaxID=45668 RepID=UPI001CD33F41|nr:GNAT family N-acetyltransferase [Halobacillus litoralis]MCA0970252.1 GNAT family N-acetyltransferase [Halobacillus litoralis]